VLQGDVKREIRTRIPVLLYPSGVVPRIASTKRWGTLHEIWMPMLTRYDQSVSSECDKHGLTILSVEPPFIDKFCAHHYLSKHMLKD
jgi:hypothetical protein